jgi:gliding motility-associated lipoprotein GldD
MVLSFLKIKTVFFIPAIAVMLFTSSCDQTYTPKPKGYFRIELPDKKYSVYSGNLCPYSFELPSYATVISYHDSIKEPCWKYIRFPGFNAEIFLSYSPVENNLNRFMEDSRNLAYKHTVKADNIEETIFQKPGVAYGVLYDIGGSAASSVQFYVTDSSRHFMRGALYFNTSPQPDSLEPVIGFLRADMVRMMETVSWNK